jgi:hypothetical protein
MARHLRPFQRRISRPDAEPGESRSRRLASARACFRPVTVRIGRRATRWARRSLGDSSSPMPGLPEFQVSPRMTSAVRPLSSAAPVAVILNRFKRGLIPGRCMLAIRSRMADSTGGSPRDRGKALRIDVRFAFDAASKCTRMDAPKCGTRFAEAAAIALNFANSHEGSGEIGLSDRRRSQRTSGGKVDETGSAATFEPIAVQVHLHLHDGAISNSVPRSAAAHPSLGATQTLLCRQN